MHKFAIGQSVDLVTTVLRPSAAGAYEIRQLVPAPDGSPENPRYRIKSIAENNKQITFSGCGNTLNSQSKQENKELTLVSEAHIVPAGIARITELQEQGWTYVRP